MKNLFLFFIAFALLGITACKRKTTETFYFNCYINGQYFEPEKQQGLGEYPLTAKLINDDTQLRIDADRGIQNVFMGVRDSAKIKIQSYELANIPYRSQAIYDKSLGVDDYRADSTNPGIINITLLDKTNMIVAGAFYFDAYNAATKDTVHITDGKFKLKYDLH